MFFDDACIEYFLLRLLNSLNLYHVKAHAYFISNSKIYLLMTPETPSGAFNLWRSVASQYHSYYQSRFERAGKLLAGVINKRLLEDGESVVEYQAYIDQQPLFEAGITHPGQYSWSSYNSNGFGLKQRYLTIHPEFSQYMQQTANPKSSYRDLVKFLVPTSFP